MGSTRGSLARFPTGGNQILPRSWRLGVWALGGVLLVGVFLLTESDGLQLLVMFALIFGLVPFLAARVGHTDPYADEQKNAPWRICLGSLVLVAPWAALTWVAVPASWGSWVWFWLVMWPWLEAFLLLMERSRQRHGTDAWTESRPLRDCVVAGTLTVPVIFLLAITDDTPVGESILTGLMCGAIVFVISGGYALLNRRAAGE